MSEADADLTAQLFGDNAELARAYTQVLADRGVSHGLLGPREIPRLWERHVYNSLAPMGFIVHGSRVADLGSGAGLPGIPLALARPDISVVLIEPSLRRTKFLVDVVDELELGDRVSVLRARAEEVSDSFDVVTARALAPLPRLAEWSAPLMKPSGVILAVKGESATDELASTSHRLKELGLAGEVSQVQVHPRVEATSVVSLRKVG